MSPRIHSLLVVTATLILFAPGCASERPPEERLPPPQRVEREPDPFTASAAPVSCVAPVSSWHAALAQAAPTTFGVGDAMDRIEAPSAWVRRLGDRGLRFEFDGPGGEHATATLMPDGFEGRSEDLGADFKEGRVEKRGRARPGCEGIAPELPAGVTCEGWTLFLSPAPKGWTTFGTDIARALGAKRPGA
jgi:hypothetical protein